MGKIKDIKANIYKILSETTYTVDNVKVYQNWPSVTASFPCVTFEVVNNQPLYSVDGELGYQDIEVSVNFWAMTPKETSSMMSEAEVELRKYGYIMQSSQYLVEDDNSSHVYTVFKFII